MRSEVMHQILESIEREVNSRPSATEFEMAYQARVAIDRIRFAIKHTEQFGQNTEQDREAGMQLLDALQRLEMIDRRFQERSRTHGDARTCKIDRARAVVNGIGNGSHEQRSSSTSDVHSHQPGSPLGASH